jgi:hypothetical protein
MRRATDVIGSRTASSTPRNARIIANASHVLMKPMPKLKAPQANAIQESQMAGPIFLISMLLGSSKRIYPMKKI